MTIAVFVGNRNRTSNTVDVDEADSTATANESVIVGTNHHPQHDNTASTELFFFDPNTVDSTDLLRLGLRPWQVRNIYKYREAGGVYSKPTDFAKLYGLTVKQYKALEPYIRISPDFLPASTLVENTPKGDSNPYHSPDSSHVNNYPKKISLGENISVNSTDTAELMRVPGIGTYYAKQIVQYGKRLGGYVSIYQLSEIEGFPETAIAYFTVDTTEITKLNVNTMSLNELKRHPYINYFQAKAITDYRRLKGNIRSLHDLHLLKDFTEEDINRLQPYVEY